MAGSIREELGSLPAEQHEVLKLAYYGGFTHHEIAEMLQPAARHRQEPDAPRPGAAAPRPRRRGGGAHDRASTTPCAT